MYIVDDRDVVAVLPDLPQSSVGAPLPHVIASEGVLALAYLVEIDDPTWDGTAVRVIGESSTDERFALVTFGRPYAHVFGPPNDEAFEGHPLASRGLTPYGTFEVTDSSWIRSLERMNQVHEHHRPERFSRLRHFVFTFHDSTFECVAEDVAHLGTLTAPVSEVGFEMLRRLRSGPQLSN